MSIGSYIQNTAKGAGQELGYLGGEAAKGARFAGSLGKAFIRNVTGGDIKGIVKSYKKGGKIEKNGLAYLHKGEKVVTASKVKALAKMKSKEY